MALLFGSRKQFWAGAGLLVVATSLLWWTAPLWQPPINSWSVSLLENFFKWQGYWSRELQGQADQKITSTEISGIQNEKISKMAEEFLALKNRVKSEHIKTALGYLVVGRGYDNFDLALFEDSAPPVGAAVISAQGFLVGRVVSVSGKTATVWPVGAANFKLSARLVDQNNYTGVIETSTGGWLRLYQLPREAALKENLLVESSAFDAVMPEGLPVATIKEVSASTGTTPEALLWPLFSSVWSQPILFEWKK